MMMHAATIRAATECRNVSPISLQSELLSGGPNHWDRIDNFPKIIHPARWFT